MRKLLLAVVVSPLGLAPTVLSAAPLTSPSRANATPLVHAVQFDRWSNYGSYGYGYGYRPACPVDYHYECWRDPYGFRHCGCLPGDNTVWRWFGR
jgi:hypothetical protein